MTMLKTLLKLQLEAMKYSFSRGGKAKKSKAGGKLAAVGMVLLFIYCVAAFGFLFISIFSTMAGAFHELGLDWFYFAVAALMSFALMIFGSVFAAKAQIYEPKDNEFLLSMPIKPGSILFVRMIMLWLLTFVLNLVTVIPAMLVWANAGYFTGASFAASLVSFLFLPLLALAVTSLLAWFLSLLSSKTGKNTMVTLLFSLVFLGAYMYFMMRINDLVSALALNPDPAARAIGAIRPVYVLCQAIAQGNMGAVIIAALVMIACFAAVYAVLSKTFIKIATMRTASAKKKYVEKTAETVSPERALLRKESARFFSSATFMLNSGLGLIMMLIAAVLLVLYRKTIVSHEMYAVFAPILDFAAPIMICFVSAMTLVSAASISLEGNSLWIVRSLPVKTEAVLKAKLRFQFMISVPPTVLVALAVLYVTRPGIVQAILQLALPIAFTLFVGLFGLLMNLRHPRLDWTNEAQIIKNSVSVIVTMFASWGILIIPIVCLFLLSGVIAAEIIVFAFMLLVVLADLLIYRWIMSRGALLFNEL